MFGTSSSPGGALQGLRLAAAIFAFILGGAFTLFSGLGLMCGCAPLSQVIGFVVSSVFALLGGFALVELWRAWRAGGAGGETHRRRANWAVFAIGGLLIVLMIVDSANKTSALQDLGPPQRLVGEVQHLHPSRGRHEKTVRLKLDSHPRWLVWECQFYCAPYRQMRLLGDAPWPMAQAYAYEDRLVGLSINGHVYLEPRAEKARAVREAEAMLAIFVGIGVLLVLGLVGVVRSRGVVYIRPDGRNADAVRDLIRSKLHSRSGTKQ